MPFIRNHKIATIILLLLSIYIYYFYTRIVPENEKIDKDIIGGIVLFINGKMIDLSVKNELNQIKRQL